MMYDEVAKTFTINVKEDVLYQSCVWLLRSDGSVHQRIYTNKCITVNCESLSAGVWFVRFETPSHVIVKRFETH